MKTNQFQSEKSTANQKIRAAFEQERQMVKIAVEKDELTAIEGHYQRLDSTAKAVFQHADVSVDCKKRCHFCCHFKTEVAPVEIFRIVEYIRSHFDEERLQSVKERAKTAKNLIRRLPIAERIQTNIPCALLEDGLCSVYSVRPSICRKKHSTDVAACKASYDRPNDDTIQESEIPLVSEVLSTMSAAARLGIEDTGLDAALYDLNEFLTDALDDNEYRKRWINGKKAFV